MKITIFTPTYNRELTLSRLYDSLRAQTCKEFIWLIVDDGSTDNTSSLVSKWIKEGKISIEYFKQENQGKSMAHNKGVELAKTELFTCVDSDDYLIESAVEDILERWYAKKSANYIGILAYRGLHNNQELTKMKNTHVESTNLNHAYKSLGLKGDTMLVYKLEVISRYKFPFFLGEKFVPEAYLYDQLDQEGELLILRKVLYICEYLNDGYTKNMAKLLKENPKGYLVFIKQRLRLTHNLYHKILDTIRYTAMCISLKQKNFITNSVYPFISITTFPLAYLFYLIRYKRL